MFASLSLCSLTVTKHPLPSQLPHTLKTVLYGMSPSLSLIKCLLLILRRSIIDPEMNDKSKQGVVPLKGHSAKFTRHSLHMD